MKKQLNPTIKAHLIRSAFYVILLLAVCVIPFALAQRNTTKRSLANPRPAAGKHAGAPALTKTVQAPVRPSSIRQPGQPEAKPAPKAASGTRINDAPRSGVSRQPRKVLMRPSGTGCTYNFTTGADTIVPGDTDTGNHVDDGDTLVALPFSFQLYDQTYSAVNVNSNGRLDFVCVNEPVGYNTACLPTPPNQCPYDFTIFPMWQDLMTIAGNPGCASFPGGTCGIFTSVTGSAPNRIFNIEWRAVYFADTNAPVNFEARLYENDPDKRFDIIFGSVPAGGDHDYVSGVQGASGAFTQDFCDPNPPNPGSRTYTCPGGPPPICGLLVGSGMTTGFLPNGWEPTLASNTVNYTFSNSQAAPNEFALFETHDPWGFTVIKDAITSNGHTYTEFTPADLTGFDFSQYQVVILNWDDTTVPEFITEYTAAIPALEAYINAGGVVWITAAVQSCDSMPMPFGGTGTGCDFGSNDPVVDPASPMMVGMPNPIPGSAANHLSFTGLPGAAHIVVITDTTGNPALYDFRPGENCGGPTPTPTPGQCQFHVLIAYSDTGAPTQLQTQIQAEPNVVAVDLFDAQVGTPTLGQLQQYDIVVPYSNFPFFDADTLGNNLADYVDGGGVVVQFGFSHYGPGQPYGINGRWVTDGYNPYDYSTNLEFNSFGLGTFNAGHPLMAGVTTLNSNFANVVAPNAAATEVAQNSLGESLVAFRPVGAHTTVGVTAYVGFDATQSGDWGKVIVNAGNWLRQCAGGPCTLGPWNIVAPYALISESVSVSNDGTFAYGVGGFDGVNFVPTNSFNQYDPVANTWTPLPNIPGAFYDAPSVYVPGTNSIYVFGGIDASFLPSNVVQIYDITAGTWTTGTPMPGPRYFAGAVYYSDNGLVYVAGGFDENFLETTTTWEYDPVANTWNTSRAPMPVAMGGMGYSIVGQNMYLAGTWNGGLGSTLHYRYDIVADAWTLMAPVPVNIYRPASGAIEDKEYLVGGGDPFVAPRASPQARKLASTRAPATSFNTTYVYDTLTDSWSTGPSTNVAHSFTGGTAVGNSLIVVTGYDGNGDTNTVEKSDCGAGGGTPTPTPTPTPTATPGGCTINGSLDGGDPTQIDRLFRSGIPQTCPASTSCAIFGDPVPRHYDAYTFTNTTGATQCITVDPTTECVGTNYIFVAAYLGSFDPNNICTNWIGDSGSSPDPTQPPVTFQFNVDNGQSFVIVVSEVTPGAGCPAYTLTVAPETICGGGTPTPTPTPTPPTPTPTPTPVTPTPTPGTPTPTPTVTPTSTPRPTPTPRPRPTPYPRPTP